ncbi:hypothetical protein CEUSTIGMA_g6066.t1, partial [Chlamydomonas eustigma]
MGGHERSFASSRIASLLLIGIAATFTGAQGQLDYGLSTASSGGNTAALTSFPFCSCTDYNCISSPYHLAFGGVTQNPTFTDICFNIVYVGCELDTKCCQLITNNLGKLEISVALTCAPQFLSATLNGRKVTTYFDTEFPTGRIRVTPLNLNVSRASGAQLCVQMKNGGCDSYSSLCANGDGTCMYATFESSQHVCCPICQQTYPPPPPAPLPPSPPSPSPPPPSPPPPLPPSPPPPSPPPSPSPPPPPLPPSPPPPPPPPP